MNVEDFSAEAYLSHETTSPLNALWIRPSVIASVLCEAILSPFLFRLFRRGVYPTLSRAPRNDI